MPDETSLLNQLNLHVQTWNSLNQICWAIFSIFTAANAGLFVSLEWPTTQISLSLVGVLVSVVWWIVQLRTVQHLNWHHYAVGELERRIFGQPEHGVLKAPDHLYERFFRSPNFKARYVWGLTMPAVPIGWTLITGWSVYSKLHSYCDQIIAICLIVTIGLFLMGFNSWNAWKTPDGSAELTSNRTTTGQGAPSAPAGKADQKPGGGEGDGEAGAAVTGRV